MAITIEIGGGRRAPGMGAMGGYAERYLGGGYGVELKQNLRKLYGCEIHFAGRGEMVPNEQSYCELDPNVVDQWGIPVLRFHFKWSDDEILQAKHMQETFRSLIECQESFCYGRCTVRQQCRQESYVDNISAGVAHVRLHSRSGEKVECKGLKDQVD